MISELSDLFVSGIAGSGHLTIDLRKLGETSDEEFRRLLNKDMENFVSNELSMRGANPCCQKCYDPIRDPKDLVRYYGINLHASHFLEIYKVSRESLPSRDRAYFDRVAKAVSTPARI